MDILVDSSVWINYFRTGHLSNKLDYFIDQNVICTNNLILAELVPALTIRNQAELVDLLREVTNIELIINWETIIQYQTQCLRKGINGIGIPDLIILDNVIQNNLQLYTLDQHFSLLTWIIHQYN